MDFQKLNQVKPYEVPDFCKEKFCQVYKQKFRQDPITFFEQQQSLWLAEMKSGSYAQALQKATPLSCVNAFMFLAIFGLSLEKCSTTTCYLECRSQKAGKDSQGRDVYLSNACITVTGYGEIFLRQCAGQIKGADSPVVIYDCDKIEFGEKDGHKFINYTKAFPKPAGSKIIGCYVRIVKSDGTADYFLMDMDDVLRLKNYSTRFNGGKFSNPLYGRSEDGSDIDTGFLKSKTIKHAFKGYPRLELTQGGAMESDKDEEPMQAETSDAPSAEVAAQGVQVQTDESADTPF